MLGLCAIDYYLLPYLCLRKFNFKLGFYVIFFCGHTILVTYYYNFPRLFYFIIFTVLCFIFCHEVQVREASLSSCSLFN